MERQPQKKISYVLPLAQDGPAGHRLGVSGLAYNRTHHTLYSGGRDGIIFAWQTYHARNSILSERQRSPSNGPTSCLAHVQAHTHWINDLALVSNYEAIVSASSDTTVKLWRPSAVDALPPQTLGFHGDYVKAVSAPGKGADWVASGSLDHHICLWDINEVKEIRRFRVTDEGSVKGSVYALATNSSLIASGGPENIVKLWDQRSGKRINQFIGHTDNIRSILLSENNASDMVISASADKSVKVWSISAGRCLYSLSMHNDSVWTLYSDDPGLDVFYSGDRSGLVVKTDSREKHDIDEGTSVGICQENEGINKMVVIRDDMWLATANSSINRWRDAGAGAKVQRLEDARSLQRASTARTKSSLSSLPSTPPPSGTFPKVETIPLTCVLRLPEVPGNLDGVLRNRIRQSALSRRRTSLASIETEIGSFLPLRQLPEESIEGQNGLVKHTILNDKRHVLTADSAGDVILWDLLQCVPVKSFGKAHLDIVRKKLDPAIVIPQWCEVDTRTGTLAVTLDVDHCFAAEVYADELAEFSQVKPRDDQRINLGAWVLRYLFADLVDEELRRDEAFRRSLKSNLTLNGGGKVGRISLPVGTFFDESDRSPISTPRANPYNRQIETPGLVIGAASPTTADTKPGVQENGKGNATDATATSRKSGEDYFSPKLVNSSTGNQTQDKQPQTPAGQVEAPTSPIDKTHVSSPKESGSSFGKRLRSTFTPKKSGKNAAAAEEPKTLRSEENQSDSEQKSTDGSLEEHSDNQTMLQVVNSIRTEYSKLVENVDANVILPLLRPALPTEAPVLRPPANTAIIIQEDDPTSGGMTDLFEGYLDQLGRNADTIEKLAPHWLGTLLLKNRAPYKEPAKIPFVIKPYQQMLPIVTAEDGNERLNASRFIRGKKIAGYIVERLGKDEIPSDVVNANPEDILELYCQDQLVPLNLTLLTIRTHIWRSGGDLMLFYKPKWQQGPG